MQAAAAPAERAELISRECRDHILTLSLAHCPACSATFDSVSDCFALSCYACGAAFCAYCGGTEETVSAVKRHIAESCAAVAELGVGRGDAVFPPEGVRERLWARTRLRRQLRRLHALLRRIPSEDERAAALGGVSARVLETAEYATGYGIDVRKEGWGDLLDAAERADAGGALGAILGAFLDSDMRPLAQDTCAGAGAAVPPSAAPDGPRSEPPLD